jgi:ADP-heptose:LPS heptosyltransferase
VQDSVLLRHVDRYIGAALCAGTSLVRSLAARPSNATPIRRILLIELFEMGAAVMLVPSIRHIRAAYPDAEIHCLTTRSCAPVWESIQLIERERLHMVDDGSGASLIASVLKNILHLRREKFDLVIDYELFMRLSALICGALRAKARAGFYRYDCEGLYRGNLYDHICGYNQNSHISKNFLALTKTALAGASDSPNYKDAITLEEIRIQPVMGPPPQEKLESLVGSCDRGQLRYFVVCPDVGRTLPMRNYPRASFSDLINMLLERHGEHRVVMIGSQAEWPTSEAVLAGVKKPGSCVNLCGKTTFSELMDVIAGADLVITNDNGPAHFATLTGTKCLVLFSTDSPFVYGPLGDAVIAYAHYQCSPCISAFNQKVSRCDNNRCLQAITPETLAHIAETLLNGSARLRSVNNNYNYIL